MKTLMMHFYREVAGIKAGSTATATNAMHRWGIPVLEGNGSERAYRYVDANDELLAKAKAAWAAESVKREAAKGNGHAHKAKERVVTDSEVIAMLTKLDDAVGLMQREVTATLVATGLHQESVDDAVRRTEAKIDSVIQHLQSRTQPTRRKS